MLEKCKIMAMSIRLTSSILVHAVTLALMIAFSVKVTQCMLEFMEGKVARSTKDMFEQYIKFPTVSICMGIDSSKAIIGFDDLGTRPMNATLDTFEFVRHLKNGYGKSFVLVFNTVIVSVGPN